MLRPFRLSRPKVRDRAALIRARRNYQSRPINRRRVCKPQVCERGQGASKPTRHGIEALRVRNKLRTLPDSAVGFANRQVCERGQRVSKPTVHRAGETFRMRDNKRRVEHAQAPVGFASRKFTNAVGVHESRCGIESKKRSACATSCAPHPWKPIKTAFFTHSLVKNADPCGLQSKPIR